MPKTITNTTSQLITIFDQLPQTYQRAILKLAKTMLKQSEKGKVKYGTDIDQNQNQSLEYWQEHAQEELADLLVYQEKIREVTSKLEEQGKSIDENI
jgi:hypothetical protein